MNENPFLTQIKSGKIITEEQLKKAYRKTAKTLHPDTTGDGRTGQIFIRMMEHYEEAREYLESGKTTGSKTGTAPFSSSDSFSSGTAKSFRPKERFFKQLLLIDMLEDPHFLFPGNNSKMIRDELIAEAEREMFHSFNEWMPKRSHLFKTAWDEYAKIKIEKQENTLENLRKVPLKKQLKILLFNTAKYALSKKDIYRLHFKGGWEPVSNQIEQRRFKALPELLRIFKEDLSL